MSFTVKWKDLRNATYLFHKRDDLARFCNGIDYRNVSSLTSAFEGINKPVIHSLNNAPMNVSWWEAFAGSKVKMLPKIKGDNYVCSKCSDLMIIDEVVGLESSAFNECCPYIIKKLVLKEPISISDFMDSEIMWYQLLYIRIEGKIKVDANVTLVNNSSYHISIESLVSIFEAFEDNTGEETQYTVTIGTAQWEKLTEEQRAIVTSKNIILAHKN